MVFLGQQQIRFRENVQRACHVKSLHPIKYNQSQLHRTLSVLLRYARF
jgi:hypothetical protein